MKENKESTNKILDFMSNNRWLTFFIFLIVFNSLIKIFEVIFEKC